MDNMDAMNFENMENDSDLANAATKIQASFRGHMARKQVEKARQETDPVPKEMAKEDNKNLAEEELDVDLSDPDLVVAATKIQASFRGHMTRKNVTKN